MGTQGFDYVVVGGGSGGCVVAARLARESGGTVALIERGQADTNRWIHIPGTFFKVMASRDTEMMVSEPDASLDGRPYPVVQAHVLGGGSSVNAMVYMRGQAADYDDWADRHGCTGWTYSDVLPVFMRQESNSRLGAPYHGKDGPLRVADPALKHPVSARLIEAACATGLPPNDDFNGATQEGAGWYQVTAADGRRQSAAVAFLRPALATGAVTVLTGTSVERLRFRGRRAVAVEARGPGGIELVIEARRGIVLTAGSFQTPKVLMLSGIGPRAQLDRHGIEVLHDAPEVGANYHDHLGAPVTARLTRAEGMFGSDRGLRAVRHGIDYWLRGRRGLLASNLLEGCACADTDGDGRPDVQFNLAPFAPDAPGRPPLPFHALQVHPMTMRPSSRGQLGLRSADPSDGLRFEARMLAAEEDLDTLRRGVRLAREIMARLDPDLVAEEVWPGPNVSTTRGSNTLDTAIRVHARTIFHPAGTCRMGADSGAVTDPSLRVNGTEALWIADCSVMPQLVSGNTNAPTMMIADRAADFILGAR